MWLWTKSIACYSLCAVVTTMRVELKVHVEEQEGNGGFEPEKNSIHTSYVLQSGAAERYLCSTYRIDVTCSFINLKAIFWIG
jgi:hypothetical protein